MRILYFFKDWSNLLAFSIGLIPTILLYVFPSDANVPFIVFVVLLFLFLIALWIILKLLLSAKENAASLAIPIVECSHNVCICKTNDFITYNSIVSFFERTGNYEELIGYGRVQNIVSGNLAQIESLSNDPDIPDLISYINNNKEKVLVRPTITADTLSKLSEYIN